MAIQLSQQWKDFLDVEMNKEYAQELKNKVSERRKVVSVYPESHLIFNAFVQCPYEDLKVIIIGLEPYPFPGVNNGLAFSCNGKASSPLKCIQNEIFEDIFNGNAGNVKVFQTNDLTQWARQGVLLLNNNLTAEDGVNKAHKDFGWDQFTTHAVKMINLHKHKLVWMLWGKEAQVYKKLINTDKHLILEAEYPTSNKFSKCNHFSKANTFIKKHYFNYKTPINWALLNNPNKTLYETT
jgi:uracil-DNA glycosylase